MAESIDILYLAWNRLEYTEATFALMLAHTDWQHVGRLRVYDDGSSDGTREYLEAALRDAPVEASLTYLGMGSPVAVMAHYVADEPADLFAKLDNDIAVPPGWLPPMLDVLGRNPNLELLGVEAGMSGPPDTGFQGEYEWMEASHIGGVGVMRSSAFLSREKPSWDGRQGFTLWQHRHEPVRGWITPCPRVMQLDKMPGAEWRSLADRYTKQGWQRHWPPMLPESTEWFDWIAPALDQLGIVL